MTFRVEDLTVSLLPEPYEVEDMADCTKCTKCTVRTGEPTCCAAPSDVAGCDESCKANTDNKSTRRSSREDDLAVLSAQLDEVLAFAGN
jgi:hypothetical protein